MFAFVHVVLNFRLGEVCRMPVAFDGLSKHFPSPIVSIFDTVADPARELVGCLTHGSCDTWAAANLKAQVPRVSFALRGHTKTIATWRDTRQESKYPRKATLQNVTKV